MKLLDYTQGNILSLYWIQEDSLYLYEIPFYGSSRLGVIKENKLLKVKTAQNTTGIMSLPIPVNITQSKNTTKPSVYTIGKKHYETTDRLGNVRVTYTDKKSWNNGKFALNVSSSQDYYPFGSVMEGRNLETINYRFGFQGQEGDDEVYGKNNLWAYKFRLHDARLGRFFSVDPLADKYPYNSVYAFSENRVIDGVELDGLEVFYINKEWGSCAGIGKNGYAYIRGSGIAYDKISTTYFKYEAKTKINNKESIIGIMLIYAKTHLGIDFSSNTFEESIKKPPVTSVDASPFFYGSIEGRTGETYLGTSVGLGLGVAHTTIETKIIESISITKKDKEVISNMLKEKGIIQTTEDTPEYFVYEKDGQNYLGYRLPRSLLGLGLIDLSVELKTNIKVTKVSEDKEDSHRWQTENYQKELQNDE